MEKKWLALWLVLTCLCLGVLGGLVYHIDPYIHFHSPHTDTYYYTLDNQRSQNDGITKHFEYDAIITGTSMMENFKTSDMDAIFGCNSIKVCYSGGSFKEVNDNLKVAVAHNPDLKIVVRGLDFMRFANDKDMMRTDLGKFPTYLYDRNPFNDVEYLFNRDVLCNDIAAMIGARSSGMEPGITPFDEYSSWYPDAVFGINSVCPGGLTQPEPIAPTGLSEAERASMVGNIQQNVIQLAADNPQITFYYFITPYSVYYWHEVATLGYWDWLYEQEKYVIEQLLPYDNIKLFSFNNLPKLITDLNHYSDQLHYGPWINAKILQWMHEGKYQLTEENYLNYLEEVYSFYQNYDFTSINGQVDFEDDFMAAQLDIE